LQNSSIVESDFTAPVAQTRTQDDHSISEQYFPATTGYKWVGQVSTTGSLCFYIN